MSFGVGSDGTVGELLVKIRPDASTFGTDTKQAVERQSIGLADVISVGAVVGGMKKITGAAAELEQAVGGTAAVFGESQAAIDEFAEGAAEAAGLSERSARELTSTIGSLLQGFGFAQDEAAATSTELAQLGADLAATFGGRPEEAVQALGAALRGEFDPLERFGISLNVTQANLKAVELGLAESTSKVDLNARAQASLAIIMERSASAQGQFARESETASGQAAIAAAKAENAAASLGENFLPIYAKLAETVGVVADAFAKLPPNVQTAVVVLGAAAALAGPAHKAYDKVAGSVESLGQRWDQASPRSQRFARGLGTATTAAAALFAVLETGDAISNRLIEGKFGDIADETERIDQSLRSLASGTFAGIVAEEFDGLSEAIERTDLLSSGLFTELKHRAPGFTFLGDAGNEAEEANRQIRALDEAIANMIRQNPAEGVAAWKELRAQLVAAGHDGLLLDNLFSGVIGAMRDLRNETGKSDTSGLEDAADATEKVKEEADKARKAQQRLNDTLMGRVDATFALRDAQFAIRDAELDVADATRGVADARRDAAEAQAAIRDAQRAVSEAEARLAELRRGGDPQDIAKAELDLAGAREGVTSANLAVVDAERKLAEARLKGDPHEIAKAELDLNDARRNVTRSQLAITDAERKLAEARQGGSPEDIAAAERALNDERQRLADAQREAQEAPYAIERAERALIQAHRDLEQAHIDVVRAQTDVTQSYEDAAAAINEGGLSAILEYRRELERIRDTSPAAAGGIGAITEQIALLDQAVGSGALQTATDQMGTLAAQIARIVELGPQLDDIVLKAGNVAGGAGSIFQRASELYSYAGADQFSTAFRRGG